MKTKEWEIYECGASYDIVDWAGRIICELQFPNHFPRDIKEVQEIKANAQLIAAAPDLLEALEICIQDAGI